MALTKHKLAAATAVAAALSLTVTPASAVELPRVAGQQASKAGAMDVENRRHGRRGHRGWYDNGIDAGDVLTGVLILGGIAAIASAAGKQRDDARYPDERYGDWDDDAGYAAPDGEFGGVGIGRAVDKCVAEVEAGRGPVGSVDSAGRESDGWRVSGRLEGGDSYWCTVDAAGRISGVGGAGTAYAEPGAAAQYDDAYYARARAAKAHVGEAIDGDLSGDAGYAVAQAE